MRLETKIEEVHQTLELFELLANIGGQMGESISYERKFSAHFYSNRSLAWRFSPDRCARAVLLLLWRLEAIVLECGYIKRRNA